MKYDAFISYRHSELDMEIAKKLHTALETYKVPVAVQKKTGKKKVQRVFRDQEELPIGSDLDDNISAALRESEYLVVICSPRTPDSVWVCREIETFIKMHDRHHVLAILIEGEPWESFPQQLLVDEEGKPVEPLAADVRGADKKERNEKFKTEILRLLAPILGCTYDDLRQRHRERQIKKVITSVSAAAAVVAVAGAAFGIYNAGVAKKMTALAEEKALLADEKTQLAEDVLMQLQGKLVNQSKYLAEQSHQLFETGDRRAAALVAAAGIPTADNDRPYVPESEEALSKALYAYSTGNIIGCDRVLMQDYTIKKLILGTDTNNFVTIDSANFVYAWDRDNWEILAKIDPMVDDNGYPNNTVDAYIDSNQIYVASDKNFMIFDLNGELKKTVPIRNLKTALFNKADNFAACVTNDIIYIINLDDGSIIKEIGHEILKGFSSDIAYCQSTKTLAISYFGEDEDPLTFGLINLEDDSVTNVKCDIGNTLFKLTFTANGNVAYSTSYEEVFSAYGDYPIYVSLYDTKAGKTIWTKDTEFGDLFNIMSDVNLKSRGYTYNDEVINEVICTVDSRIISFDEYSGEVLASLNAGGNVKRILLSAGTPYVYVGLDSGNMEVINTRTAKSYPEAAISSGASITNLAVSNGQIFIANRYESSIKVFSYHEAPDLKQVAASENYMYFKGVSPDGKYFAHTTDFDMYDISFRDAEGNLIYDLTDGTYSKSQAFGEGNKYIFVRSEGIECLDYITGNSVYMNYEDEGLNDYSSGSYISNNGKYVVAWNSHEYAVTDTTSMKVVLTKDNTSGYILYAVVSDDGKKVYVMEKDTIVYAVDIATGAATSLTDKNALRTSRMGNNNAMSISKNGKYLSIHCGDKMLRVYDTATNSLVLETPLYSQMRLFVGFTEDNSTVIVQGDDYKINVINMADGAVINTHEGIMGIECMAEDTEDGIIALTDGYSTILLSSDSKGIKVLANEAMCYMKDANTFALTTTSNIYMTKYKPVSRLLEMIGEQFTDTELSDAEKAKYAVN